jgi:hypothetical protein
MNTCIKCGCQDAYPSLPPCPTPAACPNPQPCSEVFDAQCIVFTLPDILCGLDVVVAEDSSVAEALDSIVSFFCEEIFGLVQSVTGLNTDNTDPRNPIVRISVDGTTITGLGTPASPLIATGVTGSGINNYVARWTPNSTTLGTGLIRDNNTTVAINADPALYATSKLVVKETVIDKIPFLVDYTSTVNGAYVTNVAAKISATPAAAQNGNITALQLRTSNSRGLNEGLNVGVQGNISLGYPTQVGIVSYIGTAPTMQGINISNYGVYADVETQTSTNDSVGIYSNVGAVTGGGNRYATQLKDGTQGIGKVLTCITTDGKANWVTPTGGITGSGTTDYVARWTPSGTALGIGVIRDDGTTVGIGTAPQAGSNLYVTSIVGGVTGVTNTSGYQGIVGASNGAGVGTNSGVKGSASFGAVNIGTESLAVSALGTTAIGGSFTVAGLGTNYGIKVIDGTQGINKVLTDVTGNGDAHWVTLATPPGAMTWTTLFGISPSALMLPNNGYIIRDTTGAGTLLTLPVYGTCSIGDKIEIIAAGATPATLSNWSIDPGQLGDTIYASFSVPSGFDNLEQTFTTGGLGLPITFSGAVVGAANCRKVSMTLVCIKDNGSSYIWQLTTATNYNLVP